MESHTLLRNSSSTPIEIPRRRPNPSWAGSPYARPMSPDLIFDMSPVSSEFSSMHNSGCTETSTKEPFVYSFPKISPHRVHTKLRRLPQPLQCSPLAFNDSHIHRDPFPTEHDTPSPSLCSDNDEEDILAPPLIYSSTTVTKSSSSSTTKIMGFTPVTPISVVHAPTRSTKTKRLSPPPRTSSYSSSPWIMPGRSDMQHGESGSLETDPSSFEFDRYLMRRIENQNPRRFRKVSLLSSIRV